MIYSIQNKKPQIGKDCFLASSADIIGDVTIGDNSSVWYRCVLRGDVMPIRVGEACNIQDGSIIHGTSGVYGVDLEDHVSIGHGVILHGCYICEGSLIGMGSTLMDGCRMGPLSLVGAGSLVTEGAQFEGGQLILGRPAKARRLLTEEEKELVRERAAQYKIYKDWYLEKGSYLELEKGPVQ